MERVPKNGDLLYNALNKLVQKNSGKYVLYKTTVHCILLPVIRFFYRRDTPKGKVILRIVM